MNFYIFIWKYVSDQGDYVSSTNIYVQEVLLWEWFCVQYSKFKYFPAKLALGVLGWTGADEVGRTAGLGAVLCTRIHQHPGGNTNLSQWIAQD